MSALDRTVIPETNKRPPCCQARRIVCIGRQYSQKPTKEPSPLNNSSFGCQHFGWRFDLLVNKGVATVKGESQCRERDGTVPPQQSPQVHPGIK